MEIMQVANYRLPNRAAPATDGPAQRLHEALLRPGVAARARRADVGLVAETSPLAEDGHVLNMQQRTRALMASGPDEPAIQRPGMHYEETQAGMNTGRILVASWAPQQEDRPGALPAPLQRAEVRELEPGLANLRLGPRLINGRHG
eukprot:1572842-Alexandrium_andersonii.AAC.1